MPGTLLLFLLLGISSTISVFIVVLAPAPFTLHEVQLPLVLPIKPVEDADVAKDISCLARCWVRKRVETDGTRTTVGVLGLRLCGWEGNGENG